MTNEPLTDDEHELHYNPQRAVPHFKDYQAERAASNGSPDTSIPCGSTVGS